MKAMMQVKVLEPLTQWIRVLCWVNLFFFMK